MTKSTYLNCEKKKAVRDFLLQQFQYSNVIGLAGPDVQEYVNNIRFANCNKIKIYENNSNILFKQLTKIDKTDKRVHLNYSNIYNVSSIEEDTLYDLDYCATIRSLKEHVEKFRNNFIMTFSLRKCGFKETIETFFNIRKESIISSLKSLSPIPHTIFETNKGKYIYCAYRDNTPMCCIAKIN